MPAWRCGLILLHAELGRDDLARAELDPMAASSFHDLPRDINRLPAMAWLSLACARLNCLEAAALYDLLAPHAARCAVTGHPIFCLGSTAHHLGLLARVLGRHDAARTHFETATAVNSQMRADALLAHTPPRARRDPAPQRRPGRDRARRRPAGPRPSRCRTDGPEDAPRRDRRGAGGAIYKGLIMAAGSRWDRLDLGCMRQSQDPIDPPRRLRARTAGDQATRELSWSGGSGRPLATRDPIRDVAEGPYAYSQPRPREEYR